MADLTGADAQKQLGIQKIYLKDCSFESPGSPTVFMSEFKPQITMNLAPSHKVVNDETTEVVLHVTLEAKMDGNTVFLTEVQQAGLFVLSGFEDDEKMRILGIYCPTVLYPYASEAVGALISKGGFPHMALAHVNFEALFEQRRQEIERQAAQQPPSDTH